MSYSTFAYLTNSEQKNWFSDMSNNTIRTISFKNYLANVLKRYFFHALKKLRIPVVANLCNENIDKKLREIPVTTGIVIVAKKEKEVLLRILDVLEKDLKVVCWFWDSVSSGYAFTPIVSKYKCVKFCSFDILDCEKYGLSYIEQFYYDVLPIKNEIGSMEQDVFYISNDRGRIEKIRQIYDRLIDYGLKCNVRVVKDNSSKSANDSLYVQSGMPYLEVVSSLLRSKIILEVICDGQTGPSLRAMESIFYKKKLITTNVAMRKYDFYNPNNIYIIDNMNFDGFQEFLEAEYVDVAEDILQKYRISHWINALDRV